MRYLKNFGLLLIVTSTLAACQMDDFENDSDVISNDTNAAASNEEANTDSDTETEETAETEHTEAAETEETDWRPHTVCPQKPLEGEDWKCLWMLLGSGQQGPGSPPSLQLRLHCLNEPTN